MLGIQPALALLPPALPAPSPYVHERRLAFSPSALAWPCASPTPRLQASGENQQVHWERCAWQLKLLEQCSLMFNEHASINHQDCRPMQAAHQPMLPSAASRAALTCGLLILARRPPGRSPSRHTSTLLALARRGRSRPGETASSSRQPRGGTQLPKCEGRLPKVCVGAAGPLFIVVPATLFLPSPHTQTCPSFRC